MWWSTHILCNNYHQPLFILFFREIFNLSLLFWSLFDHILNYCLDAITVQITSYWQSGFKKKNPLKVLRAAYNDIRVQIQPAGLEFDMCATEDHVLKIQGWYDNRKELTFCCNVHIQTAKSCSCRYSVFTLKGYNTFPLSYWEKDKQKPSYHEDPSCTFSCTGDF